MDILMNDDNDLSEKDGDFINGNGDIQQTYYLMRSTYNYFKDRPFYALNFINYLNGIYSKSVVERNIRDILKKDGFTKIDLNLDDLNDVTVVATRN